MGRNERLTKTAKKINIDIMCMTSNELKDTENEEKELTNGNKIRAKEEFIRECDERNEAARNMRLWRRRGV